MPRAKQQARVNVPMSGTQLTNRAIRREIFLSSSTGSESPDGRDGPEPGDAPMDRRSEQK